MSVVNQRKVDKMIEEELYQELINSFCKSMEEESFDWINEGTQTLGIERYINEKKGISFFKNDMMTSSVKMFINGVDIPERFHEQIEVCLEQLKERFIRTTITNTIKALKGNVTE